MKLKNKLYKIKSWDVEEKAFQIELVPDCIIYKAHFPEQPITPGVCIIQIAEELLEECLERKVMLKSVGNAKFLAVISPDETDCVTYTFKKIIKDNISREIKTSVIVSGDDKVFAKLSLLFYEA